MGMDGSQRDSGHCWLRGDSYGAGLHTQGVQARIKVEKIWRSSRMLVAELVVVFLGVYSAFWVDNYRDRQEREERTEQVSSYCSRISKTLLNRGKMPLLRLINSGATRIVRVGTAPVRQSGYCSLSRARYTDP